MIIATKANTVNMLVSPNLAPDPCGLLNAGSLAPKPPEWVKVSPPVDTVFYVREKIIFYSCWKISMQMLFIALLLILL